LVFPPPRPAREQARQIEPYLASIDTTLKELDAELTQAHMITPYIERVTRILERLEQREAREPCPVPAAPTPAPPAVYTPTPVVQNTMFKYFPRRSTGSPPDSEVSDSEAAPAPDTPSENAKPVRLDTPPSEGVPPRRFLTAAGEWIDLSQPLTGEWSLITFRSWWPTYNPHTAKGTRREKTS